MLLNFLIAVISQSYENVMNSSEILMYGDKIALTREAYQIISLLKGFKNQVEANNIVLSIVSDDLDGQDSAWKGFV